jgi:BON domain
MFPDIKWIPGRIDQPDDDVLAGVYDVLWESVGRHPPDFRGIEADIRAGAVVLRGHVRSGMQKRDAAQRVEAVRGVRGLRSELVADSDLQVEVAQALAANPRTRSFVLHVGASEGWIQLGGEVPDTQVQAEAETVAARVPAVRGVLGLPHLSGGPRIRNRRALQPRVGSTVYADDGEIGKVAGIVINPHDRLVSHILVDARLDLGRREVRGQFVIPAAAIRLTTNGGTTLHDSIQEVNARPQFREADFPLAPPGWQPPFPYSPDTVRWPEAVTV